MTSAEPGTDSIPAVSLSKRATRAATGMIAFFIALSVLIRLLTLFTKSYAQDDFFWAYASWLRSTDLVPLRDYYLANFTPLAEIAAPMFRMFRESFAPMYIARSVNFVIGLALLWSTYRVSRLVGASVLWALMSVNLVSWQHQFFGRIGDIRSDQIGALCLMAAAIALLDSRGRAPAVWAGFWTGLAVAITYKLLIAAPFLGIGALIVSRHRIRGGAVFSLMTAVCPALYFGLRIAIDGLQTVRAVWGEIFGALGEGVSQRAPSFLSAAWAAPTTVIAIVAGAIGLIIAARRLPEARRGGAYTLLAVAFVALYIRMNPFFFPYNFVIIVPILGPLTTGIPAICRSVPMLRLVTFMLPIATVVGGGFAVMDVVYRTNEHQEKVVRWVWSTTTSHDAIFDWQGFVAWRPNTYHWWMYSGLIGKYERGWFRAEDEIRRAQVKLAIPNYRVTHTTTGDAEFIRRHFISVDRCILLPGWVIPVDELRKGATIDAYLHDEEYTVIPPGFRGLFVDGKPVGRRVRLRAGEHSVTLAPGVRAPKQISLIRFTRGMETTSPPCMGRDMIAWFN